MGRTTLLALAAGTAAAARPSILFLMPDQWRYDWDSFEHPGEGAVDLRLPNLAKLASRGTRFRNAYVQAVVCAPSRSTMASLRDYDFAGTATNGANDYDVSIPTYFSRLRDAGGYHTMTTGKDDLTKASQLGFHKNYSTKNASDTYHMRELGFSDGLRYSGKEDVVQTFPTPHEAYGYMLDGTTVTLGNGTAVNAFHAHAACIRGEAWCDDGAMFPHGLYEDDWTAANARLLIERAPADRPFFLWVSFPGPHDPFAVTADMHAGVAARDYPAAVDEPGPPRPRCANLPRGAPGLNRTRCNYAAELENLDRLFGSVMDAATAKAGNDLVVCAFSDHGEMLDDHGDTAKSKPWQGAVSVPLVCAGPGIVENRIVEAPAAVYDLGATALDFAGVAPPPGVDASSMRGLLEGADERDRNRTVVLSGLRSAPFPGEAPPDDAPEAFDFRLAVASVDNEGTFKYVCCVGACPGSPSTAPPPDADGYTRLLFDTVADPFDMRDVKADHPDVAERLRAALPAAHGFNCTRHT